jgi:hypothetical protein
VVEFQVLSGLHLLQDFMCNRQQDILHTRLSNAVHIQLAASGCEHARRCGLRPSGPTGRGAP